MFAETATSVEIGGVTLSATAGLCYHNGTDGAAATVDNDSDGANAVFDPDKGILAINGLIVNGKVSAENGNLIVELTGADSQLNAAGNNAIYAGGNLTITGSGTLIAENGSNSQTTVYAGNAMTINGGAKVTATKAGGGAQAIHAPSITISGKNTKVTATNNGIVADVGSASYALKATDSITVSAGAILTATQGGDAEVPAVYGTVNISEGGTVKAGASAANATTLDGSTTKLENPEYKYIMINTSSPSAAAKTVEIGGVTLSESAGLCYHNGIDGATGTVDNSSNGANAVFDPDSGTLTINGLIVNGKVSAEVKGDLIVKLTGAASIINGGALNALRAYNGSLTITGAGRLTAKNGSNAYSTVFANDNITINGGAQVNAVKPGGKAQAMDANGGNIVISGADTKVVVSNNGVDEDANAIRADDGDGYITISNGASLTALKTGDDTVKAVKGTLSCDTASDSAAKVLIGNSTHHWHECMNHTEKINVEKHNISRNITEPATCTEPGKCDASCTICGAELGEQTIDPKGHQFTEVAIAPATCTEDGVLAHQHCTACNKDFIDGVEKTADELKIAATGHDMTKTPEKSATCTEAGNNEYYTCETCHKVFKDAEGKTETTVADETIAATNHDFTGDYISQGSEGHAQKCKTCTTYNTVVPHEFSGNTCAVCGYTKSSGGHYKPTQKPEIIAGEGSKADLTLNGTKATITVEEGYEITDVLVNGVSLGKVTEITGLKTGDKVEIKTAAVFNIESYVKDLKLVARSSKTANKNIRVKVASVTDQNGNPVDLSELKDKGYTVKYKFYRSEKKSSEYGERLEKDIDNNSYLNNIGDKGTKYFYRVKVMVYDANGNLAAQTELNQCRYAVRTWSK